MKHLKFKDYPEDIQDKIYERYIEYSIRIKLPAMPISGIQYEVISGLFVFSNTIEGADFWDILQTDINHFYTIYPKPVVVEYTIKDNSYKASCNGKKYIVTIREVKDENI